MIKRYTAGALSLLALVSISGCFSVSGNKSLDLKDEVFLYENKSLLPCAPDYSSNLKNLYRYYPSGSIYYHINKGVYYYQRGDMWVSSLSIPAVLGAYIDSYVTLEMDTDKPYKSHNAVKKKYNF